MDSKVFIFPYGQAAGGSGLTGSLSADSSLAESASLEDELTGALIGLAKSCGNHQKLPTTTRIIVEGLFATITDGESKSQVLMEMMKKVREEKNKVAPNCSSCLSVCGNTSDYDMKEIWKAEEDIRSLKSLILFGLRGVAAYTYDAMASGFEDEAVDYFFYKALSIISYDLTVEQLLPVVLEVGEVNLKCMELLDKENTDLYDLKQLLEQTKDKGVPFSAILSRYESKGVCILLTLLHLGIRNIYLGPALPAFLSPGVFTILVEQYGASPVSTTEED